MKTLVLVLAIITSHWGICQNRVVKDNLACLYGIKNADGAWVVKPKYILLTGYTYGYFVTQEGPNYGLIAQDGTELLPCEYSKIKPLNYSWKPRGLGQPVNHVSTNRAPLLFQVEKNNMRALVDSSGKTIVPLGTQYFRTDGQQHVIITEYRKPNHFTSYIDLQGNYVFKALPGAIEPFRSNQIALIGLRTPGSNGTVEGNVRVISKKGEYIGSQEFNRALICAKGLVVFEDSLGHIGTMDATGRILIKPKYELVFKSYSRQNILPCLYSGQHKFIIKDDEGKLGIMDGAGKVLCAPKYDQLEKLVGQWKTNHTEWRVRNNGKTGMLNENARVSIPCSYDTIIPFKIHYGRNTTLDGFIVSDSDKFGLIGIQGDTIIPVEHPFFKHAPNSRSVLFGNLEQLSEITLVDNALTISPIEKLVQLTEFSIFKGGNGKHFVLKENEKGKLEVIQSKQCMNVLWFQERRSNATLVSTSGKRLDEGNVHSVNQKHRFIEARTSEGTRYLIDAKTAKRITKPSSSVEFQLQGSQADEVWAKGLVEPIDSWVLLDTNGLRAGATSFDQPFNLNITQVSLLQDGYWGIYGVSEKEWLVPAKYSCIDEISQKIFKAGLQNGQWELHSLEAKTVFRPFDNLNVLFSSSKRINSGSSVIDDVTFLASKNGTSFLINSAGEKISNPTEIKRIQIALAYGVHMHNGKNVYSRGTKIEHDESDFKVNALYEQLYETLVEMSPRPNSQSSSINQRTCRCKRNSERQLKNELSYAKSNAVSVTISHYVPPRESWDVGYYEVGNYFNAILVNREMKKIELRAIFGYNNQLLYNEFTRAIQADETLNLECSTVENMIELVRNNFKFSEKGLILIVEQNSRRSVNVTIPWERLAQVSATKSFAKIFID